MTVSTTATTGTYVSDGTATARSIGFALLEAGHLIVAVDGVVKTLNLHYTVTGNLRAGTGSFTPAPAFANGATVSYRRVTPNIQQCDTEAGVALPAETIELELDRRAMIEQEAARDLAEVTARALLVPVGEVAPPFPGLAGQVGKVLGVNADEDLQWVNQGGADSALRTDLAAMGGASLTGWIVDAVGAVGRSLRNKLLETLYVTPSDFGADATGATNTTVALKAFYDHCIATGRTGFVSKGTYKITPGQLFFDNGGVDKAWPTILTAGHAVVTYSADPASSVDEPFIVITNGREGSANPGGDWTGGDGNYWSGGGHGGVTFQDAGALGARNNRHGFELQGMTYPKFGFILYRGVGNGSAIYLPKALFDSSYGFNTVGANNPDACAVTQMALEGVEALYAKYTIENRNYVGMDSWEVDYARGINNYNGGIFGCGQGCRFLGGSFGSCAGWAFDEGTQLDAQGGAPNRVIIDNWEIDDCQYGIRLNRTSNASITRTRFNHRYNSSFTPLNTGEGFWPRQCIAMATGASPSMANVKYDQIIHRIQPLEAGVNPAGTGGGPAFGYNALGTVLITNTPSALANITYNHQYLDNAALGVIPGDWASGFTTAGTVQFHSLGKPFLSTLSKTLVIASYTGGAPSISNTGWLAAGSIVPFNLERVDGQALYNTTTYAYTVPWTGLLRVKASLETTAAAGTRIRVGFMKTPAGGGGFSTLSAMARFKVSASSEVIDHPPFEVSVTKGDTVYFVADNNTGAPIVMTPSIAASASIAATFEMVGG